MTTINFTTILDPYSALEIYEWLVSYDTTALSFKRGYPLKDDEDVCKRHPYLFERPLYQIDVLGDHLVWLNETFPKEQYTWYHWFESVFLVPEEMYVVCLLKAK